MSSISSLFSHVDWRNKGEVSMVMPVTSSLPEGLGIVPIVLQRRRRKEGQSRRKRVCHSSLVMYNCAVVYKCPTRSLSIGRESESLRGKTGNLTYRMEYLPFPHLYRLMSHNIPVNPPLSVWKRPATQFGRCEPLPLHPVHQSELLPAVAFSEFHRPSASCLPCVMWLLLGVKAQLSSGRSVRSVFYFPLKWQTPSNTNLTANLQYPH